MRKKDETKYEKIYAAVREHYEETGNSPTIMEIAERTGISRPTVQRYLTAMREQGRLDYSGRRNIHIVKDKKGSLMIPLVGSIACGQPLFAQESIEEYIRFPKALTGTGDFFFLRAKGNSMVDAGIENGDLVLVRRQSVADRGQIVVAMLPEDSEATLKRYYPEPERSRVILKPENSAYPDIVVQDCVIQGIAVKVLKDLE